MIEYILEDKDGNQYVLNDSSVTEPAKSSLTYPDDSFEYETRLVDNSFLPGSVKIGSIRLMGRTLTFELSRADKDTDSFNTAVNTLISKLQSVKYLIDNTNGKRILVVLSSISIAYDSGSLHHSSNDSFVLECLNPYWEDVVITTQEEGLLANTPNLISVTNSGFLELAPILDITVSAVCSFVSITVNGQTIRIEDSILGTTNNETMSIDNEEGIIINNNVDRTEQIVSGLGFISIPIGDSVLEVLTPVTATLTINYRERYYV